MSPSRTRRRILGIIAIGTFLAGVWLARQAFFIEPDSLVVRAYDVRIPSWPEDLNGFRIAAVGDVHGGAPYVDEKKLEEIARRITAAKPDLIVWLGDYVIQEVLRGRFMEPERIASILSKAQARNGQIAIVGNHDRWLSTPRVEKAFEDAGIAFLRWQSKMLTVKGVRVHIYGLDDFELVPNYWPTLNRIQAEWKALPEGEPVVVLSHSPDVFPWIDPRVSLTLAAHTHGGQVRLPFIGSPIVPSSFGQRFARGHIVEKGRHLFVNTGIGTSILPLRLGVPPEISILTVSSGSH